MAKRNWFGYAAVAAFAVARETLRDRLAEQMGTRKGAVDAWLKRVFVRQRSL